jgi:PASTA domain
MPLVQKTTQTINNVAPTVGITLTLTGVVAANALVLIVGTNNLINVPSGFTAANNPAQYNSNNSATIFYQQTNAGGTINVNVTWAAGGNTYGGAVLLEFSSFAPSALDVVPAASNASITGTAGTNSVSSGTLAQATEVIFAVCYAGTSGAGTTSIGISDPPTGFTSLYAVQNTNLYNGFEACYAIVSSTSSSTASWTWTDTANIGTQATMCSFKLTALTASAGSYSISAPAVGLSYISLSPLLLANSGTYDYIAAPSVSDYSIIPANASYAFSGKAVGLSNLFFAALSAQSGLYTLAAPTVTLGVGSGNAVPNFIGMEYLAAQSLLIQSGFTNTTPLESTVTQGPLSSFGYVIGQSIPAGTVGYPHGVVLQLTVNVYRGDPVLASSQNEPIPYWYFLQ